MHLSCERQSLSARLGFLLLNFLCHVAAPLLLELVLYQKVREENDKGEHVPEQQPCQNAGEWAGFHISHNNALHSKRRKLQDLHIGDQKLPPCGQCKNSQSVKSTTGPRGFFV